MYKIKVKNKEFIINESVLTFKNSFIVNYIKYNKDLILYDKDPSLFENFILPILNDILIETESIIKYMKDLYNYDYNCIMYYINYELIPELEYFTLINKINYEAKNHCESIKNIRKYISDVYIILNKIDDITKNIKKKFNDKVTAFIIHNEDIIKNTCVTKRDLTGIIMNVCSKLGYDNFKINNFVISNYFYNNDNYGYDIVNAIHHINNNDKIKLFVWYYLNYVRNVENGLKIIEKIFIAEEYLNKMNVTFDYNMSVEDMESYSCVKSEEIKELIDKYNLIDYYFFGNCCFNNVISYLEIESNDIALVIYPNKNK